MIIPLSLPPSPTLEEKEGKEKKERKEQDLYPFKKWSDVEWRPTERSRGEGGRRRERRKESEAEGAADRAHPWLEVGEASGVGARERRRRGSERGGRAKRGGRRDVGVGRTKAAAESVA